MKRIKLTENQLHRIIKESVKKIIKETSQDLAQREYNALKRKAQYFDHGNRPESYGDRADNVYQNRLETHGEELDDMNPTPETFFEDICSYVSRNHGVTLPSGWYVEAETYGGEELYFYSEEGQDEPNFTFRDNESQNQAFENPKYHGDRSITEELYLYGKNNQWNIIQTLNNFASDMLYED